MSQQNNKYTVAYEQNAQQMHNVQPYPQQYPQQYPPQQLMYPANTTVVIAAPPVQMGYVKDYLVWSIFNLILLCPILGIFAVIFSVLSRSSKSSGQMEEARSHGQVAFGLNVAGTVLGVLAWIIMIPVLVLVVGIFSATESSINDLENITFKPWSDTTTTSWPF